MTGTDALATLNPSVIGQTEKAHNAVLDLVLAGTRLDEPQWITLQLSQATGPATRADLVAAVTARARFSADAVQQAIACLASADLVTDRDGTVQITEAGSAQVGALRNRIGAIIGPVYEAVPAEDRAVAARVLSAITAGLGAVLDQA